MRASVPALILASTLASPVLAAGRQRDAPQLSYSGIDEPGAGAGQSNCCTATAPKLAYTFADLSVEETPAILAASAPASSAALSAGTIPAASEDTPLLGGVHSDESAVETLPSLLVVVGRPGPTPAPAAVPAALPGPARALLPPSPTR
jgi:hypothetical protein